MEEEEKKKFRPFRSPLVKAILGLLLFVLLVELLDYFYYDEYYIDYEINEAIEDLSIDTLPPAVSE